MALLRRALGTQRDQPPDATDWELPPKERTTLSPPTSSASSGATGDFCASRTRQLSRPRGRESPEHQLARAGSHRTGRQGRAHLLESIGDRIHHPEREGLSQRGCLSRSQGQLTGDSPAPRAEDPSGRRRNHGYRAAKPGCVFRSPRNPRSLLPRQGKARLLGVGSHPIRITHEGVLEVKP